MLPLQYLGRGVTTWARNKTTGSVGPGVAVHPVSYCHHLQLVARFLETLVKISWDPAATMKPVCWFWVFVCVCVMAINRGDISVLCH